MPKGNQNAAGILQAMYQAVFTDLNTLLANSGTPLTTLYVSLHTASPGANGNQSTNEANYGGGSGYARVGVARTTGGWTLVNQTITNAAQITFGACSGGSGEIETYIGIGTAASGPGTLLWFGQITIPLNVSSGATPIISAGSLTVTES